MFSDAPAGCRKREERQRRVNEAKVKEEQKEEQKKKKIEQKMAQIDEKNDKVRAQSHCSVCLASFNWFTYRETGQSQCGEAGQHCRLTVASAVKSVNTHSDLFTP